MSKLIKRGEDARKALETGVNTLEIGRASCRERVSA